MKLSCALGILAAFLAAAIMASPTGAMAQSFGDAQLGFRANVSSVIQQPPSLSLQESGGMPRWVKWGLIGAVAGAATFAVLSGTSTDGDRSAAQDAALGAVFGFAVLGGAIGFYDWVCKPGSTSRRVGAC